MLLQERNEEVLKHQQEVVLRQDMEKKLQDALNRVSEITNLRQALQFTRSTCCYFAAHCDLQEALPTVSYVRTSCTYLPLIATCCIV